MARAPLDANEAASVLTLAEKLGESMDHDFVSMVSFAHWPGLVSEYYGDLRRVSKYSAVLGKFITLDEFFASTESAGAFAKYRADEYRTPYLAQAVRAGIENPLSAHVVAMHDEQLRSDTDTLLTWARLIGNNRAKTTGDAPDADTKGDPATAYNLAQGSLAGALGAAEVNAVARSEKTGGVMYVNPSSYPRRVAGGTPEAAYVDVPAFGFAWVANDAANDKPSKNRKPIARELGLVNELCEVTIHAETGGIRSIRDLHARGNRLSQQLAMRLGSPAPMPVGLWGDPDEGTKYSEMIADSIEITTNNALVGEITSRGRLVDNGRVLAEFVQATRLHANRAVIELAIELETHELPLADPWTSYYASRFAWSDDSAEIRRSLHGASIATELKRLEALNSLRFSAANREQQSSPADCPIIAVSARACSTRFSWFKARPRVAFEWQSRWKIPAHGNRQRSSSHLRSH